MREHAGVQTPFEFVDCGGAKLAVARRGAGQPILCLHATGHGGRDYDGFASRAMANRFEAISVDWPGHGASPDQPQGMTASAAAYAPLVEALVPALWPDGQKPIIIGNSIGGAAAIQLAAKRPDLVRALVLCNPGGLAPLNWIGKAYIGHMVRFFRKGASGAPSFPAAFARYYKNILKLGPSADQRARIVAAGPEMAPLLVQAWESFRSPDADIRALVGRIACPVLYAWAKDDRIVSWRGSRKAALTAPNHQVRLFPGGHSPFLEVPHEFFDAFKSFSNTLEDNNNG